MLPIRPVLPPYRGGIKFGLINEALPPPPPRRPAGGVVPGPEENPLPATPPSTDWIGQVTDWGIMGNDIMGDCVVACMGHVVEAWTNAASNRVVIQDLDLIAAYSALTGYNPATGTPDPGVAIGAGTAYWQHTGLAGHKIIGATRTNAIRWPEFYEGMITYLVQYYGAAILTLHLPQAAIDAFRNGDVWDVNMGPGTAFHCVPILAYDQNWCDVVTWGRPQRVSWGFIRQYLADLWGVLSDDWVRANGSAPNNQTRARLAEKLPHRLTVILS